jgi:rhodanese-related sulfurtransferase
MNKVNNMKNLVLVLSVVLSMFILSCKNTESEVKLVTTEETQTILQTENVLLIDVRTPEEYSEGHIINAQNIDYNSPTFEEEINQLDKSQPVLLYCKSGNRSAKSSQIFLEAGFEKIYELGGGITEWTDKGLEVIVN